MMMLIHRICMAFSGLGNFMSVAKEMSVSAAMLLVTSRGGQRALADLFGLHVSASVCFSVSEKTHKLKEGFG